MIGVGEANTFEPHRAPVLDKSYKDKPTYSYHNEEKELQDELFRLYEEIDEDLESKKV